MSTLLDQIEKTLEPIFKGLPPLPKNVNDWFVKAWPVLALVLGVLQLLATWSLWHDGHIVNTILSYDRLVGAPSSLGLFYWLGLIILLIDAVVLFMAYPGLVARTLAGWKMLFLATVVYVVFGVFSAFDSYYGGFGDLVITLIVSAIAFYFVFQVRPYYGTKSTATKKQA